VTSRLVVTSPDPSLTCDPVNNLPLRPKIIEHTLCNSRKMLQIGVEGIIYQFIMLIFITTFSIVFKKLSISRVILTPLPSSPVVRLAQRNVTDAELSIDSKIFFLIVLFRVI
jgi:hypothetical protein